MREWQRDKGELNTHVADEGNEAASTSGCLIAGTRSGRVRKRTTGFLVAISVTGLFLYGSLQDPTAARIVANPSYIDLGTVPAGETIEASVVLTNPSRVPVELRDVVTGCACTVAHWSDSVVPPGGSAEIALAVRTDQPGEELTSHVTIYYSDGGATDSPLKKLQLLVAGTVVAEKRAMRRSSMRSYPSALAGP